MSFVMVDVESDGPIPGDYSMVCFGAVVVESALDKTFYLGSLYKGVVRDFSKNFKHLRKTEHTHHPVDDAKGNAEAFLAITREHGLKIRL